MKIDKFKSVLSDPIFGNGVAQPCHYICNILPPFGMYSNAIKQHLGDLAAQTLGTFLINRTARTMSILAESASLPGRNFITSEQKLYGTLRKLPYGVVYDDIDITFICTNSMMERTFFNIWHNYIMAPDSQYMEYYQDYIGEIQITKINNDGFGAGGANLFSKVATEAKNLVVDELNTYTLHEAYPIAIRAQDLSYNDEDYMKLTVTFSYARWSVGTDSGSGSVLNKFNSANAIRVGQKMWFKYS